MVSPADFSPVAESSGLIGEIGDWVIREATRQCGRWRAAGLAPLRIAVKVSAIQFRERELAATITGALEAHALDRDRLILEITESVLMDSDTAVEQAVQGLDDLGLRFALDDFGTGFSSPSYLKRFPVQVLKIDRSFVMDCAEGSDNAHLVEAIINMAHGLGMEVTAEGVETTEQLAFLQRRRCDYVQGFLISRPLPAIEFEDLLRRGQLLPQATDAAA